MPLDTTNSAARIYIPDTQVLPLQFNWTACCWVRWSAVNTNYPWFYRIDNGANYVFAGVNIFGNYMLDFASGGGGATLDFGAVSTGTWYFCAISFKYYPFPQAEPWKAYLKKFGQPFSVQTNHTVFSYDFADMICIGCDFADGLHLNGYLAGWRMWNAVLTQEELERESQQLQAVRRDDLYAEVIGQNPNVPMTYGPRPTLAGTIARATIEAPVPIQKFYRPKYLFDPTSSALSREQEGYRWRNDDGSETTATWKASQDTDPSGMPKAATTRLRTLTNISNDPPSERLKLQYRKSGVNAWRDVP